MPWELSDDVEEFAATAGEFLRARPVQHTVLLTLVDRLRRQGRHAYGPEDPTFGWWRTPAGVVDGVLVQTPPHPMGFSALPAEALRAAVDALASRPLSAINMRSADAEAFAAARGGRSTVHMRTRLYRLDELRPAPPTAGHARTAGAADREQLLGFNDGFHQDVGERSPGPALVDEWIESGLTTLWEIDGEPVSMANRSIAEAGMVRIRAVYTPPDRRGQGFGAAATTAATEAALAAGARDVVLFTDQANQTSNRLYRRLGYQPVEDRTVVEFTS